jgi:hypothetical protein
MAVQVKIKNLPQIRAAFEKSPRIMTKNLNYRIQRIVKLGVMETTKEAPIKDGGLRGSIIRSGKWGNLKGSFGSDIEYAAAVHEGHKQEVGRFVPAINARLVQPFVKGNPFLTRAVDNIQSDVDKEFEKAVQDTLNEIGRMV